jgi:hypothetical protein
MTWSVRWLSCCPKGHPPISVSPAPHAASHCHASLVFNFITPTPHTATDAQRVRRHADDLHASTLTPSHRPCLASPCKPKEKKSKPKIAAVSGYRVSKSKPAHVVCRHRPPRHAAVSRSADVLPCILPKSVGPPRLSPSQKGTVFRLQIELGISFVMSRMMGM